MARCKHDRGNIQQFTEVCLDCGHNIYETDEEYEASLERDIRYLKEKLVKKRIERKEKEKETLEKELNGDDDDTYGGW